MNYDRAVFRKHLLGVLIGVVGLGAPSAGWAACKQSDLRGTWFLTKHWFQDLNPSTGWTHCKIRIDGNGNITNDGGTCDESGGGTSTIDTGGKFTLKDSCKVVGSLKLVGEPAIKLTRVQMEKTNKTIFSGAGQQGPPGEDRFSNLISAVKK